jgi:hypothetical protein
MYWAFSFPSTIIIVFGTEFVFSCGTMFVAEIALPHEQSVAGALFQTIAQVGAGNTATFSVLNFG